MFFVQDKYSEENFFALTIRAPVAPALFKGIDHPKLHNSYALIQADDIPGINRVGELPVPILAGDSLAYIGEPVALLVGPDRSRVEEFATQCIVQTEPLLPDADLFFAEYFFESGTTIGSETGKSLTGTYRSGIQEHWYPEPHGAYAAWSDEHLCICTATQWPALVQRAVARMLAIAPELVHVESAGLGTTLDGKIWYPALISCHAALCADWVQRPVRVMLTREEDFRFSPKRNSSLIRIDSIYHATGEVSKTTVDVAVDLGSSGVFAQEILDYVCLGSTGLYDLGALHITGKACAGPSAPHGPCAGFGLSQGFFALECHVSRLADRCGQDPAEWRKQHFGKNLPIGVQIPDHPLEQLIDSAAQRSDYYRKWTSYNMLRTLPEYSPHRGIGVAVAFQCNGFLYEQNTYEIELTLKKDGCLDIKTGGISENISAVWRNYAMEILSIEPDKIRIFNDPTIDSGPMTLSRSSTVLTPLIQHACVEIKKQLFRDPLPITVRYSMNPEEIPSWNGRSLDRHAVESLSFGAAVVEVELDNGIPRIRTIALSVEAGHILNKARAERILKTNALHALSWASRERLSYREGLIPEEQFYAYSPLPLLDAPEITISFLENASPPKGIGELPFSTIPAAYIQALSQALNHPFGTIPLTMQDIAD
ncbi:aldehyde oxidase [Spirochaetia bacterium]|nr:aldehyde oxidase [Spirochaetia bacterium]